MFWTIILALDQPANDFWVEWKHLLDGPWAGSN